MEAVFKQFCGQIPIDLAVIMVRFLLFVLAIVAFFGAALAGVEQQPDHPLTAAEQPGEVPLIRAKRCHLDFC
ncbi:hypothetical protein QR680_007624 [Steinernema hermaphroditum]|uniref:Uncharacterized protein n=1 Tax=Steinernema hermaphroditum TaxID=289476 RepID=A0AA39M6P5_9BILA|nr:hypothetical protein QR680_007624 [Steinernema hermaphroditum]